MSDRPTIRLRPKAEARAIRHGFPWVYDNEIVTDRRTKALAPGTIARLEDAERRPLAVVAVNPGSRIFARVLERNAEAVIDAAWLEARLRAALAHRQVLFETPFYRLVHAEADGLPGVVIDRFGETLVIQPNAAWAERMLDDLVASACRVTGAETVVINGQSRARALEGLSEETRVARGEVTEPVPVEMNRATYFADLLGGQKTGLFFDQRDNHAATQRLVQGIKRQGGAAQVLDVFSHVGGFALATLAAGADAALSVDSSAPALALAEKGAEAMGAQARFATRRGDAFDTMAALAEEGALFDVVICDPPAFAPNKKALQAGLRAYERVARLAAVLVRPGGYLALCSCSHAADLSAFRAASARGIGKAGRQGVIHHTGFAAPDHPQLPQLAESAYLKSLMIRLA